METVVITNYGGQKIKIPHNRGILKLGAKDSNLY
jgi:hypothetical protein